MALAGRPLSADAAGRRGRRLRGRHGPARRRAPSTGPRHGDGVLDADLWAGWPRRSSTGSSSRRGGAIAFRHESIGRAVERDLLPVARTRHHAALAASLDGPPSARRLALARAPTTRTRPGSPSIEAAAFAGARHAAADELAALELALAAARRTGRSGAARRRRRAGTSDRVELQVRAAEAAFAVGPDLARHGLPRGGDRRRSTRGATGSGSGLLHERLAQVRRAAGDPAGRDARGPPGGRARPARAEPGAGDRPGRPRPAARCSTASSPRPSASPARRSGSPAPAIRSPRDQEVHATTTLGVALAWGSDPAAAIELLREAEAAARELDDPDALFRIRANLTTVLDLVGRRTEAVEVAYAGIEDARRAGLEAVYGNFLRGNVADIAVPARPLARGAGDQPSGR